MGIFSIKGVSECIHWMVNNPMKELGNRAGYANCRYNDNKLTFEFYYLEVNEWLIIDEFEMFKEVWFNGKLDE